MICAIALLVGFAADPMIDMLSPVVLYRLGANDDGWKQTNRAIQTLAHMSPKAQIRAEMKFFAKVAKRAEDPWKGGEFRGRRYEWFPILDIGKLDLLRVAMGKSVTLQSAEQFSFLCRATGSGPGIQLSGTRPQYTAGEFDYNRPVSLSDVRSLKSAKWRIRAGYYVVRYWPH